MRGRRYYSSLSGSALTGHWHDNPSAKYHCNQVAPPTQHGMTRASAAHSKTMWNLRSSAARACHNSGHSSSVILIALQRVGPAEHGLDVTFPWVMRYGVMLLFQRFQLPFSKQLRACETVILRKCAKCHLMMCLHIVCLGSLL